MIGLAQGCLDRLKAALQPTRDSLKSFILTRTKLNGRAFSLKGHEYQEKILDELSNPDIELVIQKPSQIGVSEIIYRAILGWCSLVPGYAMAVIFPTARMGSEVFSTRVATIIDESEALKALRNKNVDSNTVKMFLNNSIMYALGASPMSKSTVINRPIRTIIVDELARCDRKVVTSMASRQRHQEHKSSVYFSTPLFEGADIDEEMGNCGVLWEQILTCNKCEHEFFPDFYANVKVPGFTEHIKQFNQDNVDKEGIDPDAAYLECPECKEAIPHEIENFRWVDTAKVPTRPKVGIRLGAFCMPRYVGPADMVKDWLRYLDKVEFHQQVLGLPATKAHTAMDTSQFTFEDLAIGNINVMGIDIGKISHIQVGTVTNDRLLFHTRRSAGLKDLREIVVKTAGEFNCIATVIDMMPYTDVATDLMNQLQNCWLAMYIDPGVPIPELYKPRVKEDESFGTVRQLQINKNLFFDTYVNDVMQGRIVFQNGGDNQEVREHHEAMRRLRDEKFVELRYKWVKVQGNKNVDHWFHSGIYCMAAARMMLKSTASSLPISLMMQGFKMKHDL